MINGDVSYEIKKLKETVKELTDEVKELSSKVNPQNDLWDNVDMIKYWKISSRLLSDWRSKGLIDFVQVGNKIWYSRECRELFLSKHTHIAKEIEEMTNGK